jgi:hypothetical protein
MLPEFTFLRGVSAVLGVAGGALVTSGIIDGYFDDMVIGSIMISLAWWVATV